MTAYGSTHGQRTLVMSPSDWSFVFLKLTGFDALAYGPAISQKDVGRWKGAWGLGRNNIIPYTSQGPVASLDKKPTYAQKGVSTMNGFVNFVS